MTYFLLDKQGYLGDIGTSLGLQQLNHELVEKGETADIAGLAAALRKVGDEDLAAKVERAIPPILLTDGIVDE